KTAWKKTASGLGSALCTSRYDNCCRIQNIACDPCNGSHDYRSHMEAARIAPMKKYVLVRWKKRWPLLPGGVMTGTFAVLHSLREQDGQAIRIVILLACFVIAGILFPFHWGREDWNGD